MKNQFEWYFQPTDDEIKQIWENAIFTVDTSVLLDLYRYHEDTRKNILDALEKFKSQIWLSHQVASEFLKNRMKVIIDSKNSIDKVENTVGEFKRVEISKLVKALRENRMISIKDIEKFESSLLSQIDSLIKTIGELKIRYPDFRKDDAVLQNLLAIFDGNIGKPYPHEELAKEEKEADNRFQKKIPPGYEDIKNKDYPYGDYFVWKQIMEYAKSKQKPLIFITSEKKEDWWEEHSGQTVGPRLELKKEFFETTQQKLLMYRTDRFIEYYSKMNGLVLNDTVIKEIRDVTSERITSERIANSTTGAFERVAASTVKTLYENVMEQEDYSYQFGVITVELQKDVYRFTCSGHVSAIFDFPPNVSAKLVDKPLNCPQDVYVNFGTGTTFDFHIHIKSNEYGIALPRGIYAFEYRLFAF